MAHATLTYEVTVHDNNSDNEVVGEYLNLLFEIFQKIDELAAFGLETRTQSIVTFNQNEAFLNKPYDQNSPAIRYSEGHPDFIEEEDDRGSN